MHRWPCCTFVKPGFTHMHRKTMEIPSLFAQTDLLKPWRKWPAVSHCVTCGAGLLVVELTDSPSPHTLTDTQ